MIKIKRLDFLDVAKGIGILVVVYAHVMQQYIPPHNILNVFIYSFHMPLFFVLSGIVSQIKENSGKTKIDSQYIKKKFFQLMIPYFVFSLIYIILNIIQVKLGVIHFMFPDKKILFDIVKVFTLRGLAPLWFLASLFVADIIWKCFINKFESLKSRFIIVIIIFFINYWVNTLHYSKLPNTDLIEFMIYVFLFRTSLAFAFMVIGSMLSRYFVNTINQNIINYKFKYIAIFTGFFISLSLINLIFRNGVNMHLYVLGNPIIFYLTSILGSLTVIMLSIIISNNKILQSLGKNSLSIMVLHYPPMPFIQILTYVILGIPLFLNHRQIRTLFVTVLTITLTYFSGIFLVKYCPIFFGKKRK
ncbi:acyltransferase family protein [Anaerosacchariphilus polymeriproducens]|uniref:Acyltransferase 3 domain-containing protein n=1 Tax=Anaerosacchariphilus polymeriproducens TaxID=1812858 RepID=A0A371ASN8_9FIRM|nr:acyltransferase family protein [Anaerosacchariphilus polymeriproducens]RDU22552.1 hypothetical protein DWV06_14830 [Anaerosacchariphilus polymeriproducens]